MDERVKVVYKTKKSTGKTVTIVILLLLLIASLSYTAYDKLVLEKDKNKPVEDKKEEKEMYYNEVDTILKQIDKYNHIFKSEYPISDIKKVDNQLKLQFGIYALTEDENIKNYYKIDDIEDIYTRYFIKGFNAIYENIDCPLKDGDLYKLNNKTYTINEEEHEHGSITMDTNTFYVNNKIEGNKYIIDTHILYSNYCSGTCNPEGGYYKSYKDAVEGENPVTYKISSYDDIKDELPITRFTFIKHREKYLLKSIEIK